MVEHFPGMLKFLTSPEPDFEWLRKYPSRDAGKAWRRVKLLALAFIDKHKSDWDSPNITIAGEQVTFLKAEFPLEGTRISLMVSKDAIERTDGEQPVADVLVTRGPHLVLQRQFSGLVLGSDTWKDQQGQRLWFIAPGQNMQVSRPLVNCVKTILTFGERHFTGQHDVPSPS